MSKWKLQIRNKIEDSCIEEPVKTLAQSQDETIGNLAKHVNALQNARTAADCIAAGILVDPGIVLPDTPCVEDRLGKHFVLIGQILGS